MIIVYTGAVAVALGKRRRLPWGYCFDYEQEDSWSNHIDAICALAIATVLIGMGLAAVLHIGLWMLEVI